MKRFLILPLLLGGCAPGHAQEPEAFYESFGPRNKAIGPAEFYWLLAAGVDRDYRGPNGAALGSARKHQFQEILEMLEKRP